MTETPASYRTGRDACPGCGSVARPHHARGVCRLCYMRLYRSGRASGRVPNWGLCGQPEPPHVTVARQRILARRGIAASHGWRCALALEAGEGRP